MDADGYIMLAIIIVLAIATGVFAYMWHKEKNSNRFVPKDKEPKTKDVKSGKKDEDEEEENEYEEEILSIIDEGHKQGAIMADEALMISNIFEFGDKEAKEIMRFRKKIVGIDVETSLKDAVAFMMEQRYSRFPVYEEDIDKIIGVINQKDFHYHVVGTNKHISDYVSPVVFVAETMKIFDLLRKMQQLKTHMAIVIDEYGGTSGLVTMEDIIEELVGEIYDEYDVIANKEIMPLQNGSYRVRCSANLAKVFDYFEIDEDITEVNTVNGWVSMMLDHLPKKDDRFETEIDRKNLKVRVTKADARKAIEINLVCEDVAEEDESERSEDRKDRG